MSILYLYTRYEHLYGRKNIKALDIKFYKRKNKIVGLVMKVTNEEGDKPCRKMS